MSSRPKQPKVSKMVNDSVQLQHTIFFAYFCVLSPVVVTGILTNALITFVSFVSVQKLTSRSNFLCGLLGVSDLALCGVNLVVMLL